MPNSCRNVAMNGCSKPLALVLVALFLAVVVVTPVYAAASWSVQTLDANGADLSSPNAFPIAVDSNGNLHIAYTDILNAGSRSPPQETYPLMYASLTGSQWSIQQVAPNGFADSLAFDAHNNPHILLDSGNYGLMYANWNGSNWNMQTVDSQASYGSLALDSAGNPHVAYTEPYAGGQELEYASWTGANWTIQTVATQYTQPISSLLFPSISLALNTNNSPYIAYFAFSPNASTGDVYLAVYSDSHWSIQTVASNVTSFSNMVLDSSGYPHLIYAVGGSTLVYASWNGTAWNAQNVTSTLDTGGLGTYVGRLTQASLALDSRGYPHIAYVNSSFTETTTTQITSWGYLAYASWTDQAWNIQAVNSNLNVASCSLAVDSKGNPHVSLIGINPDSTAAQNQLYGAYTYTAPVLYATATEPTPTSPPAVSELPWLAIIPLMASTLLIAAIARHRKQVRKLTEVELGEWQR